MNVPPGYEAQVLGNRRRRRAIALPVRSFVLWQVGGAVAIAVSSQSSALPLSKLQGLYAVVALTIGGLEAFNRGAYLLYGLGLLGMGLSWVYQPDIAFLLWIYGAIGYLRQPRILAIALCWFSLVLLTRTYLI